MSKKIIINKELSLPIISFTDRSSAIYNEEKQRGINLTVELDLNSEDFPYSLPSDIFIHCDKYYAEDAVTLIEISKNDKVVYQTDRYNHLSDINFQFHQDTDEISGYLVFDKILE